MDSTAHAKQQSMKGFVLGLWSQTLLGSNPGSSPLSLLGDLE